MAGQPKKRAIIAELEKRARDSECDDMLGYACDYVASGHTLTQLADDIGRATGMRVNREQLTKLLHAQPDAEARIARARATSAHGLAEQAVAIIDEPAETREELAHAKQRADVRLWLAERFNREAFGAPKGGNVSISVNVLHLDALRSRTVASQVIGSRLLTQGSDDAIAQAIALEEPEVTVSHDVAG